MQCYYYYLYFDDKTTTQTKKELAYEEIFNKLLNYIMKFIYILNLHWLGMKLLIAKEDELRALLCKKKYTNVTAF